MQCIICLTLCMNKYLNLIKDYVLLTSERDTSFGSVLRPIWGHLKAIVAGVFIILLLHVATRWPRWCRAWQPCCELLPNFSVFRVFYLFFVLDVYTLIVYDRHTLLEIGSSVAHRKPDFEFLNAGALFTNTASEPFVRATRPETPPEKREES